MKILSFSFDGKPLGPFYGCLLKSVSSMYFVYVVMSLAVLLWVHDLNRFYSL